MLAVLLAVAVLGGFLLGLFAFKVKARWCQRCGAVLECVDCLAKVRRA